MSVMSDKELISRQKVYLSPHSDDVCFSLGMLAYRSAGGFLLSIFGKSAYTATRRHDISNRTIEHVSGVRRKEDAAFAEACNLQYETLDLLDAPLRGLNPFGSAASEEVLRYVEGPLLQRLSRLAPDYPGAILAVPAGIGNHIDHVAVRDCILANLPDVCASFQVAFYEDLHYASVAKSRLEGLSTLRRELPAPYTLQRSRLAIAEADVEYKLISLYASQFKQKPEGLDSYSPAEELHGDPHEALWLACRTDAQQDDQVR